MAGPPAECVRRANYMRRATGLLVVASIAFAVSSCAARAGDPALPVPAGDEGDRQDAMRPVATMSELMVRVLYPYSDNLFYIATRTPSDDAGWSRLETETLLLAETTNLLMAPSRARGDLWVADARLLLDVAENALSAIRRRDVAAIEALNDPLYESCTTCHEHFRPGYGRR